MPADWTSVLVLILLTAADTVERLGPYVLGGIAVAILVSWWNRRRAWIVHLHVPCWLVTPLASLLGVLSPVPTMTMVPLVVRYPLGIGYVRGHLSTITAVEDAFDPVPLK